MGQANPELPRLTGPDEEHAQGILTMWHDPSMYDPLRDGPPYLPPPRKAASVKTADEASAMAVLSQILQNVAAAYEQTPMSELAVLLAFLRAEGMIHQSHHWMTRGTTFYGDHLLYDRLYNDVQEHVDRVAERAVGSGGHLLAHPTLLAVHVAEIVKSLYGDTPEDPSPEEYPLLSLRTALRFLAVLRMVYAVLEKRGQLSHGTDNLLQDIADKHEEHVYLLKQRTTVYDRRS